jgi:general secretion pathway protein F
MPRYRYAVVDARGKTVRGLTDAPSKEALADRFVESGRYLVEAVELRAGARFANLLHGDILPRGGIGKRHVMMFTRQLATMLGAGQDIDRALSFILETASHSAIRSMVELCRNEVRGGKSFAAALAEQPRCFSPLYVSLVKAGEAGGQLASSLGHLADLMEREVRLASTVRSAMIYPALVTCVAIVTIGVLLGFVIPQFAPIFIEAGAQVPPSIQILLTAGDLLRDYGLTAFFLVLLAGLLFRRALDDPQFRRQFDTAVLRVPLVGTFIRRSEAARFTRTLGTLLINGVPLLQGLNIVRGAIGNRTAHAAVVAATERVQSGARLSLALREAKFFTPETIHFLGIGEETGKLGEMSLKCADLHDEQVSEAVKSMVTLLVPAVTLVMGLFVGGIIVALLLAMLSLNDLAL